MKVVINKQYCSFGISAIAIEKYLKSTGRNAFFYRFQQHDDLSFTYAKVRKCEADELCFAYTLDFGETLTSDEAENKRMEKYCFSVSSLSRSDEKLIQVVEELGEFANTKNSNLKIIEIPDNSFYRVQSYDGFEWLLISDSEIKEIR